MLMASEDYDLTPDSVRFHHGVPHLLKTRLRWKHSRGAAPNQAMMLGSRLTVGGGGEPTPWPWIRPGCGRRRKRGQSEPIRRRCGDELEICAM